MLRNAVGALICALITMAGVVGCGTTGQSIPGNQTQGTFGTASAPANNAPLNWLVPNFKAVDEYGKTFESSQLDGHVWIADVFYTSCPTVCPPIANNMAHLQKQLASDGLNVQLVSFSVDPQSETSATLQKFGQEHGADFSNWHFLRGYSFKWIQQFSLKAFKTPITQTNSKYYSHTVNWYLVDKSGKIVQLFNGLHPQYDKIIQAVKSLE